MNLEKRLTPEEQPSVDNEWHFVLLPVEESEIDGTCKEGIEGLLWNSTAKSTQQSGNMKEKKKTEIKLPKEI